MFIRSILLLLAISPNLHESVKIHDVVKSVGKRFESNPNLKAYANPAPRGSWVDTCSLVPECEFNRLTDDQVARFKVKSVLTVRAILYHTASSQNKHFAKAMTWLSSIIDPEMEAEICDAGVKKLNAVQYLKHVIQTASLFQETPGINWRFQLQDGNPRNILRFHTFIVQYDKKFNLSAQTHYDITLKAKPELKSKGTWFQITKVYQGGICPEHGAFVYKNDDEIDVAIDNIEDLKNHPTARVLLNFFTPLAFQFEDPEKKRISSFRIQGLKKDKSKLSVCQDGLSDPVTYTVEEFERWYSRLQVMWHPKKDENGYDEEFTNLLIEKIEENQIIAMVTLKLQMGLNEKVQNWNFRVSAVKDPEDVTREWYIDTLEVPCNLDYNYKDESFAAIADVIGTTFVEDFLAIPKTEDDEPKRMITALNFVRQFMKPGYYSHIVYCDYNERITNQTVFGQYTFDINVRHITKISKYWIDHSGITKPAPDVYMIAFRTISAGRSLNKDAEFETEWKFEVVWDKMDQFYYAEEMRVGCYNKIIDGKYDDGVKYTEIDYNYGE